MNYEKYGDEKRGSFLGSLGFYGVLFAGLFLTSYYGCESCSRSKKEFSKEFVVSDTLKNQKSLDTLLLNKEGISSIKFKN